MIAVTRVLRVSAALRMIALIGGLSASMKAVPNGAVMTPSTIDSRIAGLSSTAMILGCVRSSCGRCSSISGPLYDDSAPPSVTTIVFHTSAAQ